MNQLKKIQNQIKRDLESKETKENEWKKIKNEHTKKFYNNKQYYKKLEEKSIDELIEIIKEKDKEINYLFSTIV